MTVEAARTHLEVTRPPYVDSCYDFSEKFRVSEKTGTMLLRAARYAYIPEENRWKRMPSQMDMLQARIKRLEVKIDRLLEVVGFPAPTAISKPKPGDMTLSEAIRAQRAKEALTNGG